MDFLNNVRPDFRNVQPPFGQTWLAWFLLFAVFFESMVFVAALNAWVARRV